eukprot:g13442.t1
MTSTAIFTCYRQLHPPTGVDHAVFGSVTAAGSRDLVVAKASILELYRVHRDDRKEHATAAEPPGAGKTAGGDGDDGSNKNEAADTNDDDDDATSFYLELAGTFPLAGNITSLAIIPVAAAAPAAAATTTTSTGTSPLQRRQPDILVVSFGDAKMALVAYDTLLGRLETVSIHNFDAAAIGPGAENIESGYGLASAVKDRPKTMSAADPAGRCLAAVVAGCQLVVLPARRHVPRSVFVSEEAAERRRVLRVRRRAAAAAAAAERGGGNGGGGSEGMAGGDGTDPGAAGEASGDSGSEEEEEEEEEEDGEGDGGDVSGAHVAVSKPFTIDLEEAGVTGFIKAAAFLEGFHEPALALLYEPVQTCAGRLASMRSTCRLVVFSLNLTQGRAPAVWQVDSLPHDSCDLVPVPSPVGGVQVISTNAVIHVNQSEVRSILAVNGYARATVEPGLLGCPLRGGDSDWGWASFRRSHSEREVVDLSSYDVCVELDVVKCAFLTPTVMLISLRTGEVYALRLHLSVSGAAGSSIGSGARVAGGGGAPNRVVGQSMRPVGRASPCSVLAVSSSGGGGGGDSDSMGGGGGGGASTGLVFLGSRVGDSLLVKYAVASAGGTQSGRRGRGAAVGGAGLKRELKVEAEKGEWEGGGGRGEDGGRRGAVNGAVGGGSREKAAAVGEASSHDPVGGVGRANAVKEEPKEAAGPAGMDVDNYVGHGGSGDDNPASAESSAAEPPVAPADASREAAAVALAASEGARSDMPAPPPSAAETSESPVVPTTDGGKEADSAAGASTATETPTKRREAALEKGEEGDPRDGADSGGGSGSGKRSRGKGSPSPGDGAATATGSDGDDSDGAGAAVDDDGGDQPDKKRPRVSSSPAGSSKDDLAVPTVGTAPPPHAVAAADQQDFVPAAAEGTGTGAGAGSEAALRARAEKVALSPENGGVVKAVDAMDTTSPAPSAAAASAASSAAVGEENAEAGVGSGVDADGDAAAAAASAENFYGEDEETTRLILQELEMIHEEEELYGMRLGSSRSVGARSSYGAPLANLGSKAGERVVEAVGFRLKVVDSICTLGPIVDAALVPSAYRVPKTAVAGSRGHSAAAAGGGGAGGATSGGGIRTSLVCAAGYGGQGSLSVFSAGLRTEVVVELSVPGATGVFTAPEGGGRAAGGRNRDTLVLVSCSSAPPPQAPPAADERRPGHTRVLAFEEDARVVELADGAAGNPFVCDAATADVCVMAGGTVVQAHAQGLRVTRDRAAVFDVLASDDPEFGGLGAEPGVSVVRAAAAGSHACCLLSNLRLHLMALDDGDLMPLLPAEEYEGEGEGGEGGAGGGAGGVWEEVEAVYMFGIQERAAAAAAATASSPAEPEGEGTMTSGISISTSTSSANGHSTSGITSGKAVGVGLFLEATVAPGAASPSPEEENLGGGGVGSRGGGLSSPGDETGDDDDDDDDDTDEDTDSGYDSEAEEWATLYAAEPGRGILNPCASQDRSSALSPSSSPPLPALAAPSLPRDAAANGGGPADRGHQSGDGVGSAGGGGDGRAPRRSEEGGTQRQRRRGLEKGWWGGCAWGGTGSKPTSAVGDGAQQEREEEGENEVEDSTSAYLVVCRKGGSVEVFSCEGRGAEGTRARLVFRAAGAALAPCTLWNELLVPPVAAGAVLATLSEDGDEEDVEGSESIANGGGGGGGKVGAEGEGEDGGPVGLAVATGVLVANGRRGSAAGRGAGGAGVGVGAGGEGRANGDSVGGAAGAEVGPTPPVSASASDPMEVDGVAQGAAAAAAAAEGTEGVGDKGAVAGGVAVGRESEDDGVVCPAVVDVIVHPVGAVDGPADLRRLVLAMYLDNGSLLVYEARMSISSSSSSPLRREQVVCFSKLCHDLITRPVKGVPPEAAVPNPARGRALRAVRAAAGQEGISFARPGCLGSLAPLYNPDAFPGGRGGGFAGVTAGGGRLRFVSAAPAASQLVTPGASGGGGLGGGGQGHFVAEKVRLGATVHGLVHLPHQLAQPGKTGDILKQLLRGRGHYVAIVSTMEDALAEQAKTGLSKDEGEGEEQGDGDDDEEEEAAGLLDRHIVKHKVRAAAEAAEAEAALLLSSETVESHPMDSGENAICLTLVRLEQGGSPRMYVAVGTGLNEPQGEDKAARGRLLLYEVDYAYLARENGKHEHAVKLRQVFAKEQLGPVTGESGPVSAVAQLGRHLILSVGKKVIVNRWDPKTCTLELIGFHDPRVYVISLSVIKNRFILVGDAYGSVQLVVWREEDHSLTALSKDHEDCQVFSAEYLIDEPGMAIVVADGRRNIKVLQYAPNATNSRGGTKLLCQSDFYLGSRVAKLTRRRTRGNLRDGARYCLLAGTLDGGLGAILPVDERVFRRLYALQGIMSNALGHNGAANPRAYRLFDHGPTFRYETKQNMLDGSLLWRFVGLDARTQHDLTRAIGTTVDRVMANLLDIDLASLF